MLDYIRLPLNTYPGNFTVAFEQYKIDAINVLNFSHSKYFYTLKDCLGSIFNGVRKYFIWKIHKLINKRCRRRKIY